MKPENVCVFVIVGLLLCFEATGSRAKTTVFVKEGDDLVLELNLNLSQGFRLVLWRFNESDNLVRYSFRAGVSVFSQSGRIEPNETNYSVKLKNLQVADSGVYTAFLIARDKKQVEYVVIVQAPVSPVHLTVDCLTSSSDSSNMTVTCSTNDSHHINSIFTCDSKTCSQEGGERSKVMTSGASLGVYLSKGCVICNHSNQVSWTQDKITTEQFCPRHPGFSFCLVKMIVFSVGLTIMIVAVVTVHVMEKFRKQK